ncbi:MAG: hypothetical protein ACI9E1_001471, partial [Cryomorphaceae bacterium]
SDLSHNNSPKSSSMLLGQTMKTHPPEQFFLLM